ncbi:MAG: isoprenyl transferase [Candidatus Azobacteroides sp.]|nr:isoprenyl transferase [Candidatus Azobacteroides sp.]
MSLKNSIDTDRLPVHIAIIMDGNGRWAKNQGLDRMYGHQEGVTSVKKAIETASNLGIKYLTLYTFSTENWNRPQEEVNALMELMVIAIKRELPEMMQEQVKLNVIGDIDLLPPRTKETLDSCIEETSQNTGLNLVLAISYSSRWEIATAVKNIATEVLCGKLNLDDINEDMVSNHLSTRNIPDPDLLIRTGGEFRISNFLMWQIAYSELHFSNKFWPDFREEELYKAIVDYQTRERRFGKTGDQIK